eukprot:CAMPEP_0178437512 /NCGR_PEP_ID=MMETSP0689_2-20121128/35044_1 /TAXON_ID=160604 /ORGANISM="Amphidinium massartii, Strain CS-259" /LENGTH=70 /DNA_ID=CAMNT_0020059743 /DNA_START=68 /DNA_END=280 /DNA_ORIENTATION=+
MKGNDDHDHYDHDEAEHCHDHISEADISGQDLVWRGPKVHAGSNPPERWQKAAENAQQPHTCWVIILIDR